MALIGFTVLERTFDAASDSDELKAVKDFLRVTHSHDDETLLPVAIFGALEFCEDVANVAFVDCKIQASYSRIPTTGIELPRTALRSVESVEALTLDGWQVIEPDEWEASPVGTFGTPARVYLKNPPAVEAGEGERFRVVYRAGLADTIENLKGRMRVGMWFAINHFYAHRNEQNPDKTLPRSVIDLITARRQPVL